MLLKWERLRRWFIRSGGGVEVEDRPQRLTLGSLARVHRAEVHYRVVTGYFYEGMVWERLVMPLIQRREKPHRLAIKSQQNVFWTW